MAVLLLGTRARRAFMITILTQAVVVTALVVLTFGIARSYLGSSFDDADYKTLPCYLALFILAEIFEVALALDALRLRNDIQLYGVISFHAALIAFSAIQIHETKAALVPCHLPQCNTDPNFLWDKVMPIVVASLCVISASWVILFFWIRRLWEEFGWDIFRVVEANPSLKSKYFYYQVFICLLKFDFFSFLGVTMQLLIIVLATNSAEFGITVAAIPVALILIAGCAYAVQHEIKWLMIASLALMVASLVYLYKLVKIYEPSTAWQYLSTRYTLTTFTATAILLLLISFIVGIKCLYDFDNGLINAKTEGVKSDGDHRYSSIHESIQLNLVD